MQSQIGSKLQGSKKYQQNQIILNKSKIIQHKDLDNYQDDFNLMQFQEEDQNQNFNCTQNHHNNNKPFQNNYLQQSQDKKYQSDENQHVLNPYKQRQFQIQRSQHSSQHSQEKQGQVLSNIKINSGYYSQQQQEYQSKLNIKQQLGQICSYNHDQNMEISQCQCYSYSYSQNGSKMPQLTQLQQDEQQESQIQQLQFQLEPQRENRKQKNKQQQKQEKLQQKQKQQHYQNPSSISISKFANTMKNGPKHEQNIIQIASDSEDDQNSFNEKNKNQLPRSKTKNSCLLYNQFYSYQDYEDFMIQLKDRIKSLFQDKYKTPSFQKLSNSLRRIKQKFPKYRIQYIIQLLYRKYILKSRNIHQVQRLYKRKYQLRDGQLVDLQSQLKLPRDQAFKPNPDQLISLDEKFSRFGYFYSFRFQENYFANSKVKIQNWKNRGSQKMQLPEFNPYNYTPIPNNPQNCNSGQNNRGNYSNSSYVPKISSYPSYICPKPIQPINCQQKFTSIYAPKKSNFYTHEKPFENRHSQQIRQPNNGPQDSWLMQRFHQQRTIAKIFMRDGYGIHTVRTALRNNFQNQLYIRSITTIVRQAYRKLEQYLIHRFRKNIKILQSQQFAIIRTPLAHPHQVFTQKSDLLTYFKYIKVCYKMKTSFPEQEQSLRLYQVIIKGLLPGRKPKQINLS